MEAVQNTDAGPIDKWDILADLTDAAKDFALNHRTLGVLKALMTFLPERLIPHDPRKAVVFPSNRTLANRLNGMPDSTLRRHLAALVRAGIVSRHDSANRKRFARHLGQGDRIAFGFDLSPLARRADDIHQRARAARTRRDTLLALRAQVAHLRQRALLAADAQQLTEDVLRLLRRKPVEADLRMAQSALEDFLCAHAAENLSSTDDQIERHIQDESIYLSDSETSTALQDDAQHTLSQPISSAQSDDDIRLQDVTETCKEYRSYFPDPVRHWHDLARLADRLTPMIGIEPPVFKDAIKHMGLPSAATAVVCILEQLDKIRNPGGYLRRLTQHARGGGFNARLMLDAIARNAKLSADNSLKCGNSIC